MFKWHYLLNVAMINYYIAINLLNTHILLNRSIPSFCVPCVKGSPFLLRNTLEYVKLIYLKERKALIW